MPGIGELSVSITARTQKATRNIQNFRTRINSLPASIAKAATSMKGLATAALGLAGVASIGYEIQKSFSNIDSLAKTSDKLGIATEKLASLRFAAEESGVSASTLDTSLQRMVRRVSEAARGSGEAVGALDELGLSAERLAGLSPDRQFSAIADAMNRVTNQGDRVRLAMKLFDSEGVSLINTLRLGSQGLNQYEKDAEKLGLTVNRFEAAQIEKANDAFGRIGKAVEGVTNRLAIGLAPIIEAVAKRLVAWGPSAKTVSKVVSKSLRVVAKSVGVVLDTLSAWDEIWTSIQYRGAQFFAWLLRQTEAASNFITRLVNKIPGVNVAPIVESNSLAREMEEVAERARIARDNAWSKPLPSESIDRFFNNLDAKIAQSKMNLSERVTNEHTSILDATLAATEGGLGGIATRANGAAKMLTGGLSDSMKRMDRLRKEAEEKAKKPFFPDREAPGILSARTAEGFAQLRSSKNRGTPEKQLEEEKKQVAQGGQMIGLLGQILQTFEPSKVIGFNDA